VKVNEDSSRTFDGKYGCVQGSVAGSTLFSIMLSQSGHVYSDLITFSLGERIGEDNAKNYRLAQKVWDVSKTEACLFQQKYWTQRQLVLWEKMC
jgi:hypothetical protein